MWEVVLGRSKEKVSHASKVVDGRHISPLPPVMPRYSANQLRQLQVGKEIVMKDQNAWVPARLIRCRTTHSAGQICRCCRSCHEGVQEYKRTFKQEQQNWGVIRGENVQLDLNDPGVELVPTSFVIRSPCKECNQNIILMKNLNTLSNAYNSNAGMASRWPA